MTLTPGHGYEQGSIDGYGEGNDVVGDVREKNEASQDLQQ
jgi:hypothetical protein